MIAIHVLQLITKKILLSFENDEKTYVYKKINKVEQIKEESSFILL